MKHGVSMVLLTANDEDLFKEQEHMSSKKVATLELDFCGMKFDSPLVLLSGCVGFGEEYTRIKGFSNRDAGAICLKGTTLEPRLGNPAHRLCETPMGLINAIGLQNPGTAHVIEQILPTLVKPVLLPMSPALRWRSMCK